MNIEKDEKVLDFFIERELDPLTQVEYIRHIKYYIEHAGDNLTPTQLIDEAIEEERAKVPHEDRKIEKRFKRFKKWLLEQDYSSETKRGMLGCIKTFYITSHVNLSENSSYDVNSVNKCLFSSLNNLTASFHALFIGSLSNFRRARVRNIFKSCVNTVADVLVSSSFTFTNTTFAPPMFLCLFISSFNKINFSVFYVLCALNL